MTLVDHLGELRARLVVSMVAIVASFIVAYVFHGDLVTWLERALPPEHRKLTTFSVGENGSPPARIAVASSSPVVIRLAGIRVGAVTDFTSGVRPLCTASVLSGSRGFAAR